MKFKLLNLALYSPYLLAVVFAVLRLCGAINWSWWWVLSPVFIPAGIGSLLLLFLLLIVKEPHK